MGPLEKLYRDELADLYDAEQQILKALPKMVEGASSRELKNALQQHRMATEGQVKRLETIFRDDGRPAPKKCKGMAGLLAEGDELLKEGYEADVQDAGIIGAAQRVEHYEIAAYGTARALAEQLGKDDAVALLQQTLDEEKEADALLTEIAESSANAEAEGADDDDEGNGPNGNPGRSRSSMGTTSTTRKPRKKTMPARTRRRARAKSRPSARH